MFRLIQNVLIGKRIKRKYIRKLSHEFPHVTPSPESSGKRQPLQYKEKRSKGKVVEEETVQETFIDTKVKKRKSKKPDLKAIDECDEDLKQFHELNGGKCPVETRERYAEELRAMIRQLEAIGKKMTENGSSYRDMKKDTSVEESAVERASKSRTLGTDVEEAFPSHSLEVAGEETSSSPSQKVPEKETSHSQKVPGEESSHSHTQKVPGEETSHSQKVPGEETSHSHTQKVPGEETSHSHTQKVPGEETSHSHTQKVPGEETSHSHTQKVPGEETSHSHTQKVPGEETSHSHTQKVPGEESSHSHTQKVPLEELSHSYSQESSGVETSHSHAKIEQYYFRKWKNRSLFQVLEMYRADKHQHLILFSQQVHLYGQETRAKIQSLNVPIDISLVKCAIYGAHRSMEASRQTPQLKMPLDRSLNVYFDTSNRRGTTLSRKSEDLNRDWEDHFKTRTASAVSVDPQINSGSKVDGMNPTDDVDLLENSEKSNSSSAILEDRPFWKDKVQLSTANEEATISLAPNRNENANVSHGSDGSVPVTKRLTSLTHFSGINAWEKNRHNGYTFQNCHQYSEDLRNSSQRAVEEMRDIARTRANSESIAPFNFQSLLRKTNYKRESMKRGDDSHTTPTEFPNFIFKRHQVDDVTFPYAEDENEDDDEVTSHYDDEDVSTPIDNVDDDVSIPKDADDEVFISDDDDDGSTPEHADDDVSIPDDNVDDDVSIPKDADDDVSIPDDDDDDDDFSTPEDNVEEYHSESRNSQLDEENLFIQKQKSPSSNSSQEQYNTLSCPISRDPIQDPQFFPTDPSHLYIETPTCDTSDEGSILVAETEEAML